MDRQILGVVCSALANAPGQQVALFILCQVKSNPTHPGTLMLIEAGL